MALEIPVQPNKIPGRILILTVCLCGSLIFEAYNAGLISFLTTETYEFPIKNLEDLVEDSEFTLLIESGTANIDYFKSATMETNPAAAKIWSENKIMPIISEQKYLLSIFHMKFDKSLTHVLKVGDFLISIYVHCTLGWQRMWRFTKVS